MSQPFDYDDAFSRNIGWLSHEEQQILRSKRVAMAGMGGVGGDHAIRMARLGVGAFSISDLDVFEQANFNRQYGATMNTVDRPKVEVMRDTLASINPEADIRVFPDGINEENAEAFLEGVDLYIDSLDFFTIDIRRVLFRMCREKGIPAITAAPMGMGTAFLCFTQDSMSFDDYFDFDSAKTKEEESLKFLVGLSPSMQQRHYVSQDSSIDFENQKVPSTGLGISLAAGVACANGVKLLLNKGDVIKAPRGLHFDAYRNALKKTWRPGGNRNPLQKLMFWVVRSMLEKQQKQGQA